MNRSGVFYDTSVLFIVYAALSFVSGTVFLMWLGEQITDKGIGNGISLIIFVGIVLRFPSQIGQTFSLATKGSVNYLGLILWLAIALVTIVSIVFMYQGQRRIPVQQARRVVGRKMFAGRSSYIPLRLNNAGVISIIFAISILLLPQQALSWFGAGGRTGLAATIATEHAALLRADVVPLQPRVLLAGRDLHVLLLVDRRQHQRHRRQPEKIGLVHPRHPAGRSDRPVHQQDPLPDHDRRRGVSRACWPCCRRCSRTPASPSSTSARPRS